MRKTIPAIRVISFTILLLAFSLRAGAEEFANLISPPYYMAHYEGSTNEGELKISANYTVAAARRENLARPNRASAWMWPR